MRQSMNMPQELQLGLLGAEVVADSAHPNKMKFRGILVQLDKPSTKPPNGSQGHRILVPTDVARRRLKTLIGMGINYAPDLDAHAQRRKVGVIDKAWIDGNDLRVEGHIWKHDFPEAEKDLKKPNLGMSMELGDVRVDNPQDDIWTLDDFQFLGATVLWRDSAAYRGTQAIAARAEQRRARMKTGSKSNSTARVSASERVAQIAAEAAAGAVKISNRKLLSALEKQTETLSVIAAQQEELEARVASIEAGRQISAEDNLDDNMGAADGASSSSSSSENQGEHRVKAARKKDGASSSSSSSSSSEEEGVNAEGKKKNQGSSTSSSTTSSSEDEFEGAVDTGDLDDSNDSEGNAGHANEDAENRGEDGAGDLAKKVGKTVSSAREKVLRRENRRLREQLAASGKAYDKLESKMDKLQHQVSAASTQMGRRSISPEIQAMLQKANLDAGDLLRTGVKLSVAEVDGILASSGVTLRVEDRMAIKSQFYRSGLMEDGRVQRARQ